MTTATTTRGRLERAWDALHEQKLAQLDQALERDLETFRVHAPEKVEGLKRFNAAQRRVWEDPNPPESFTPAPQSYVERPLTTDPAPRETIRRVSETSWETVIEVPEDDDNAMEWGPEDGRS
jgi:hypothetical protein